MTIWKGWSAATASRLSWEEWREQLQRRVFFKPHEATMRASGQPDTPVMTKARIVELEQYCSQLALENTALKTALEHWQRQPVPAGG